MTTSQLLFDTAGLRESGGIASLQGTLPLDSYRMGDRTFTLGQALDYDLQVISSDVGCVVSGQVSARIQGECSRCLEPAEALVEGPVECWCLTAPPEPEEDLEEDEYLLIGEDGTIDLGDACLAALILETPVSLLCDPDCQGLCPHCGVNLNQEKCSCGTDPDPDSPFAVLKDFTFQD